MPDDGTAMTATKAASKAASTMSTRDGSSDTGPSWGGLKRTAERLVAHVPTVAFHGIDVLPVDVQVQIGPGMPAFTVRRRLETLESVGQSAFAFLSSEKHESCGP